MHKNAIKRAGRVNFWKKSNYKKPETRPELVMSNPNPKKYFKTRPEPEKNFKTRPKPEIFFQNPT